MSNLVEGKLPCPSCPSSDAYHLYDDGHGYCFSCQYYKPPEGAPDARESGEFTYQYVPLRGVSAETFRYYGIKTKVDQGGSPRAIGYPYPNGSTKIRRLDKKEFYWSGTHSPGLFGIDRFAAGSHQYVTITEGELDALSLYQVIRSPVVSVQAAGSAVADVGASRDWLSSFERVYLAFDGDAAGREAAAKVAKLFDPDRVFHVRFTRPDRKDANSYVELGEGEELRNLWNNAKRYLPEQVVSSNAEFKKILEEDHRRGVPYPFTEQLNEMTYGIRTGESVLITAQEGIGKTEFMHAIEHKLLKETDTNVAAIYLEELPRRHLQALAGIELQKPVHLPDSGVGQDTVYQALETLLKKDDRLYLFNHFGSNDPRSLLDTIRFLVVACGCTYVLLDHITMVPIGISGEDERKALDWFSSQVESMVKELDYALLIVSHVNDFGQTRGSRYISKIADIRIDLSRDVLNPDPILRNTTPIMVSKNRFSGRTGAAGDVVFDTLTGCYKEVQSWPTSKSPKVSSDVPSYPTPLTEGTGLQ